MINHLKHFVITRFLSRKLSSDIELLDSKLINSRLKFLVKNLISTLNNQTNHDFEFILLVNPCIDVNTLYCIQQEIIHANPKFKCLYIPDNDNLHDYINSIWDKNDMVVITRIDDDDFVHRDAVSDIQKLIKQGNFEILACGYDSGYKYIDGENVIYKHHTCHANGYISIFESVIYNTKKVQYKKDLNPCCMNHTKIKTILSSTKYDVQFISLEKKDAYIYFRHATANSFQQNGRGSGHLIEMDSELKANLYTQFGLKL